MKMVQFAKTFGPAMGQFGHRLPTIRCWVCVSKSCGVSKMKTKIPGRSDSSGKAFWVWVPLINTWVSWCCMVVFNALSTTSMCLAIGYLRATSEPRSLGRGCVGELECHPPLAPLGWASLGPLGQRISSNLSRLPNYVKGFCHPRHTHF